MRCADNIARSRVTSNSTDFNTVWRCWIWLAIVLDQRWELSLRAGYIFKEPLSGLGSRKKRHQVVICLEKRICVPNGTKLPLKWLMWKRREQFFFLLPTEEQLSRQGMQELKNETASWFVAYINRRSPQSNQTFWGWVIAPKQVRIRVSTNLTRERKVLLGKEGDHWRKKLLMDLKGTEVYKAHPALSPSHRGND